MRTSTITLALGAALVAAAACAGQPRTNSPAQPQEQPKLCVYRGPAPYGPKNNPAYAAWLGVPAVWGEDTTPQEHWDGTQGGSWQLRPWSQWKQAAPGRRLVLTVVILPGAWDLSGPKIGTDGGKAVSWEAAARGDYNKHFQKLAENLVKAELGDSLIRLGHEFNGGWYTWRSSKHEKEFAAYWRQIVNTMGAVPGTDLKFVFNPSQGYQQCGGENSWPGDEYVEYVGLDVYDQSWLPETYPLPADATEKEILARRKKVWNDLLNGNHGMVFWRDFAIAHHKPFCIPEWGVWKRKDGHGGGDNPDFIEQMHQFIMAPANRVAWHCYFDYTGGGEANHQLSPSPDGTYVTDFPRSAARFKELFGEATSAR